MHGSFFLRTSIFDSQFSCGFLGFFRGKEWEKLDGDVVSPRFTPWCGWTEKDSWCRRVKWPGRPRGRRKHTSWRIVSFMPFATLFTGDVAECYGDQNRYGDPHTYADPDDLLVYATVALSWNQTGFISHLCLICASITFKYQMTFLSRERGNF